MKRTALAALLLIFVAAGCGGHTRKGTAPSWAPAPASSVSRPAAPTKPPRVAQTNPSPVTVITASLTPIPHALPNLSMTDATFVSAQTGWITGAYGMQQSTNGTFFTGGFVARTTDGGKAWRIIGRLPSRVLTRIHFVSPKDGYAIGSVLPNPDDPIQTAFGKQNVLFKTTDGGATWSKVLVAKGTLKGWAFSASGGIWAAVSGPCTKTACQGALLHSTDAGAHWRTALSPPGPVLSVASRGGRIWAETVVAAPHKKRGGTVRIQATHDGGRHWSSLGTLPNPMGMLDYFTTATRFTSTMKFTSAQDGLVTIFSLDSCAMHGCGVTDVFRTTDGGAHWSQVNMPRVRSAPECGGFQPLLAIGKAGVAVDRGVNLAACAGPGNTLFTAASATAPFDVAHQFPRLGVTAIGLMPDGRIWALGGKAMVMTTPKKVGNPGSSTPGHPVWAQVFPAVVPTGLIHFVTPSTGYGAGDAMDPGAILKTTDGGARWLVVASLSGRKVISFSFVGSKVGFAGAVPMLAENTPPAVLKTTDGGKTWKRVYQGASGSAVYPAVHFFTAGSGMLVNLKANCACRGTPLVMTTVDGGRHWQPVQAPNGLKLGRDVISTAMVTPRKLIVVTMATQSHGATIQGSSDGGKTWTTVATLPKSVEGSMPIDFVSSQVGYIAVRQVVQPGGSGTVNVTHAAVMKTIDGGKHWTLESLAPIPGEGSASVSFVSPTRGWLRTGQTLWQTTDGGKRWTQLK